MSDPNPLSWPQASALKRLLVMLYDGLIAFALVAIGTVVLLPFSGGEAIPKGHIGYQAWLIFLLASYFVVSWALAGQTVGMRAWRLYLIDAEGKAPRWSVAFLRFFAGILSLACLGIGILWMLIDPLSRGWHDLISRTSVVRRPLP